MNPRTVEILQGCSESDWLHYYNELVIYAEIKCKRKRWNTGNNNNLPDGFSAKSIAREAIKRLFTSDREWNHEKYPENTPVRFLKSVVRSIVSDLFRKKSHRTTSYLEDESRKVNQSGDSYEVELSFSSKSLLSNSSDNPNPYEELFFKEVDQRVIAALKDSKDSKELFLYYSYRKQGLKNPEIAIQMEKTKEQIDRLRRTFSRRTEEVRKDYFSEMTYKSIPERGDTSNCVKKTW